MLAKNKEITVSEVARLMREIDQQCEAVKNLMSGVAVVASHSAITHRYAQLGQVMDRLGELIGADAAEVAVMERYIEVVG